MSAIQYRGGLIYGEFHKEYNFGQVVEYIKEVAQLCRQKKCYKALMDIRGVPGKISTWDRFRLAQISLHHFDRSLHLVVVYRPEEVNGFFEDVMVNRGGNFRIFTDMGSACQWLGVDESTVVVK
jgi:hypothetical protein